MMLNGNPPQLEPSRIKTVNALVLQPLPAYVHLIPSAPDWKMGMITLNISFQKHGDSTGIQTCISPPFLLSSQDH